MSEAQLQVLIIFFSPLALFFLIQLIPIPQLLGRQKVKAFMRFTLIFTYAPILYIFYGLIATGFDTMAVLDGQTVYTLMMGITIMFGIIMMSFTAIARLYFLLRAKKII